MPRNAGERTLVFVNMANPAGIKYGFRSGLRTGLRATFGQEVITASTALTGLIIGANSPKPPRASKQETAGIESSFCANEKINSLKADGWTITKPKRPGRAKTSGLAKTQYITLNGVKYAWNSPDFSEEAVGTDVSVLGVTTATASEAGLIWGASFPKPPRMVKKVGEAGFSTTVSSFVDPTKIDAGVTAGWRSAASGAGSYSQEDLAFLVG